MADYAETFNATTGLTTFRFNGTVWPCSRNASVLQGYSAEDLATQEPYAFLPPPETGICPPNAFCFVDAPWLDPPSQCGCSLYYSRVGWGCEGSRPFAKFQAFVALVIFLISFTCGVVCGINILALIFKGLCAPAVDPDVRPVRRKTTTALLRSSRTRCLRSLSKARTAALIWGVGPSASA